MYTSAERSYDTDVINSEENLSIDKNNSSLKLKLFALILAFQMI